MIVPEIHTNLILTKVFLHINDRIIMSQLINVGTKQPPFFYRNNLLEEVSQNM